MPDGTRLALDVYLPEYATPEDPLPVLMELAPYWRSSENPQTGQPNPALVALDRYLSSKGKLSAVPAAGSGRDAHAVDFSVNTGDANRWDTQMGTPVRRWKPTCKSMAPRLLPCA